MADAFSTGWSIFKKSVTQIVYNLTDAIKISGPLWVFIYLITLLAGEPGASESGEQVFDPALFLIAIAAFVLIICGFCWIAILWHRYMLLSEGSENLISKWNGSRVWAYFKNLFIISLVVLVVAAIPYFVAAYLLSEILINNPFLALLFGLVVPVLFYYLSLRFGLVLPSVALDKPVTLGNSFIDTDFCKGAIFVASLLLVGSAIIIGQLVLLSGIDQYTFQLPSFAVNWFFTMTGISILTTLYGYVVEKRELA